MKSKILSSERGQALVVIALAIVVLFGFMALAIDGSAKLSDRRHAQNAADTAAVAAALAKVDGLVLGKTDNTACPDPNPSPVCVDLTLEGLNRAISNGYGDDSLRSTVTIYSPPISGYYKDNKSYVQVIITSHVTTYFMHLFGIDQTDNTVQAVAYADKGGSFFNGAALISVDPSPNCSSGNGSGGGSFSVGGASAITLSGGGMFVNSNNSCGYSEPSCTNLSVPTGGISSAGSAIDLPAGCPTNPATNTTQAQHAVPDDIYMPDKPTECSSGGYTYTHPGTDKYTFNPGYYTTFPPANQPNTNSHSIITLSPGVYCIDANVSWSGSEFASLAGSGVTLYITAGHEFKINTSSTLSLSAPTSPNKYAGYAIIVDGNQSLAQGPNPPGCAITGGSNITMSGTIYAPYCSIIINGNSSTNAFGSQVVAWDVTLNGANALNFTYDPSLNAKAPRRVGLMK